MRVSRPCLGIRSDDDPVAQGDEEILCAKWDSSSESIGKPMPSVQWLMRVAFAKQPIA